MISALRLVISENGKLIDAITKETGTQPAQLIKTLEEFRHSSNAALSKLIEDGGDSDDYSDNTEENNDEEDDGEDDEQLVSPTKRKR